MADYMTQSLRDLEANSGQNLYNRMVQRGSRRAGANRERSIQAADDLLGMDPNVLQETILKIDDQAGREFQDVESNATMAEAETAKSLAKFKYEVGLQEQARKDQTVRDIAALGGGLLAAGTNIYGAKLGADALKSLMNPNDNPAGITPTVPELRSLVPNVEAPVDTPSGEFGDMAPRVGMLDNTVRGQGFPQLGSGDLATPQNFRFYSPDGSDPISVERRRLASLRRTSIDDYGWGMQ